MNPRNYTFTMLGALIVGGVISHTATNPGVALGVSLVAIMIAIFATIHRAEDAGKSPALWGFLVFVPFAWIWLACQPTDHQRTLGVRIV